MLENRILPQRGQLWRHFKGSIYEIVALARDSEDLSRRLVVYGKPSDDQIWVRPLAMFMERHDSGVWRFEPIMGGSVIPIDPIPFTSEETAKIDLIMSGVIPESEQLAAMCKAVPLWSTDKLETSDHFSDGIVPGSLRVGNVKPEFFAGGEGYVSIPTKAERDEREDLEAEQKFCTRSAEQTKREAGGTITRLGQIARRLAELP